MTTILSNPDLPNRKPKHAIYLIVDCKNGNPNGDPMSDNLPRISITNYVPSRGMSINLIKHIVRETKSVGNYRLVTRQRHKKNRKRN